MTQSKWEAIKEPPVGVERYFINMIENNLVERKHMSNISKMIQLNDSYIKDKWELEANVMSLTRKLGLGILGPLQWCTGLMEGTYNSVSG